MREAAGEGADEDLGAEGVIAVSSYSEWFPNGQTLNLRCIHPDDRPRRNID